MKTNPSELAMRIAGLIEAEAGSIGSQELFATIIDREIGPLMESHKALIKAAKDANISVKQLGLQLTADYITRTIERAENLSPK